MVLRVPNKKDEVEANGRDDIIHKGGQADPRSSLVPASPLEPSGRPSPLPGLWVLLNAPAYYCYAL